MKCPNCNAENPEGMKFCGECGTKLPEPMNHCPTCNKDWPLTMKFCGECGFKFDGGSAAGAGGLSMGDKNVIAGDVVSNVSNVDNSSTVNNTTNTTTNNTTTVINQDETKQIKKCHICGSIQTITTGYECPECHEYTCNSCFNVSLKICPKCIQTKTVMMAQAKSIQASSITDAIKYNFESVSNDDVMSFLKDYENTTSELFVETQKKLANRYYEKENWDRIISVYEIVPDNLDMHDGDSLFIYGLAIFNKVGFSSDNRKRLYNVFSKASSKGNEDSAVFLALNNAYSGPWRTYCYNDLLKHPDNKYAQYYLGLILEEPGGNNSPKMDKAKAVEWFNKSAAQGYKPAVEKAALYAPTEEELQKEEMAKSAAEEKASFTAEEKRIADEKKAVKYQKIQTLLDKYSWEKIGTGLTRRDYKTGEIIDHEEWYKLLLPGVEKIIAPVSGTWQGWKTGIKPLFGEAVKIETIGQGNIWTGVGNKAKKGDWIGIKEYLPELSLRYSLDIHETEEYSVINEKYVNNFELISIGEYSCHFFGYFEKDEIIYEDSEGKNKIISPCDAFYDMTADVDYDDSKKINVTDVYYYKVK